MGMGKGRTCLPGENSLAFRQFANVTVYAHEGLVTIG
jgi:hypothetical protein